MNKAKKEFITFLENLVHKRMSIKGIKIVINEFLKTDKVYVVKSEMHWNNPDVADYMFVGSTEYANEENENIPFCDFDIYVLPTKEEINGEVVYYITEVGYEFDY